jgi:energy-coupling factor transport system permease protein
MMVSLTLRFIPTLINETNKIMKAQASRGVDFYESSFRQKVKQIVSLLVPMFVISFKKAEDLANAMESRGYVIDAPRTRLDKLKPHLIDFIALSVSLMLLAGVIVARILI